MEIPFQDNGQMAMEQTKKRRRERTRWGPDDGEEGSDLPVDTVVSPSSLPSREAEHEAVQPQAAEAGHGAPKRRPKRRRWGSDDEDEGSGAGLLPVEQVVPVTAHASLPPETEVSQPSALVSAPPAAVQRY